MRVSRSQAAENRNAVIDVASRLFRRHGFDGIGLKDLMEGAGLTQGAFYKQFDSKEDLAVEASRRALKGASDRWATAIAKHPDDPLGAVLSFYLSKEHRAEIADGCPFVALGADAIRHGGEVKRMFEEGVNEHLERLRAAIGSTRPDGLEPPDGAVTPDSTETKALAVGAMMVGAMMLTRLVDDPKLAEAFLDAAAKTAREIAST